MVTPLNLNRTKENIFKKILIVFLIFLLLLSNSFIIPKQKAEAFAWSGAIPAGITFAGGAYAVTALAVGGTLTKLGIDHGEEISNSAAKVWGTATDLAKESINTSIDIAKTTGQKVVQIGHGFWDWVSGKANQIVGLANTVGGSLATLSDTPKVNKEIEENVGGEVVPITIQTAFPEAELSFSAPHVNASVRITLPENSPHLFVITHSQGMGLYSELDISVPKNESGMVNIRALNKKIGSGNAVSIQASQEYGKMVYGDASFLRYSKNPELWERQTELESMLRGSRTVEDLLGLVGTLGLDNIGIGVAETYDNYISGLSQVIQNDLPAMRDAGLVLPIDNALPYESGNPAKRLEFDEVSGDYVGADGKIYTGQVDWSIPQVRVVTGVDGIPYTVTQTADGVIIDVRTGEGVTTTDNPFNPPGGGGNPDITKSFNLRPLIMLGDTLKEKFPFSIPWDVFALFSVLNVEPITPKFSFNTDQGITIGGKSILVDYDFDIDFSIFDPIAKIIRWGLILVFDISIILALRRLTPD